MDNKLAHLQMIETVISRMAGNSFLLKGWSITLVSALFALAAAKSNIHFVFLAYYPAIMLWILDGYFLRQERLFRKLYDYVREQSINDIDFSMDANKFANNIDNLATICFSLTLRLFHGTIVVSIIIVMLILFI